MLYIQENIIYCDSKDIFKNIENIKFDMALFFVPVTESNKTQLIKNINDFKEELEDTNFSPIDKKEFIKTLEEVANNQPSEAKKDNGLLNKDLSKEDLKKIHTNFQESKNKAIISGIIKLLYPGLSSAETYTVPSYQPKYNGDDSNIKPSLTHIYHNLTSYLLRKGIITESIEQATLDQILPRFNLTQNTDNNTTENYLDIVTANFGKEGGSYEDSKETTLENALSCYLMAYEMHKNKDFLSKGTATCLEQSLRVAKLMSEKSPNDNKVTSNNVSDAIDLTKSSMACKPKTCVSNVKASTIFPNLKPSHINKFTPILNGAPNTTALNGAPKPSNINTNNTTALNGAPKPSNINIKPSFQLYPKNQYSTKKNVPNELKEETDFSKETNFYSLLKVISKDSKIR